MKENELQESFQEIISPNFAALISEAAQHPEIHLEKWSTERNFFEQAPFSTFVESTASAKATSLEQFKRSDESNELIIRSLITAVAASCSTLRRAYLAEHTKVNKLDTLNDADFIQYLSATFKKELVMGYPPTAFYKRVDLEHTPAAKSLIKQICREIFDWLSTYPFADEYVRLNCFSSFFHHSGEKVHNFKTPTIDQYTPWASRQLEQSTKVKILTESIQSRAEISDAKQHFLNDEDLEPFKRLYLIVRNNTKQS